MSGGSPVVHIRIGFLSVLVMAMASCAPAAPGAGGQNSGQSPAPSRAPKTITIAVNEDVTSLWDAVTSGGGTGARELADVVNQHLVAITADGSPTPRLLTELPSQDRGTWNVQADGTM